MFTLPSQCSISSFLAMWTMSNGHLLYSHMSLFSIPTSPFPSISFHSLPCPTATFSSVCSFTEPSDSRKCHYCIVSTRISGAPCVAILQGRAGSWCSWRWNNIHGAIGMSGVPLFTGGWARHAASCMSICMSHVMALAPQCGTHRGTWLLVCLHVSLVRSPYLLKY